MRLRCLERYRRGGARNLAPASRLAAAVTTIAAVHGSLAAVTGDVPHLPAPNFGVRRHAFVGTSGFTDHRPFFSAQLPVGVPSLESKSQTRGARFASLYGDPWLLMAASLPLVFAQTAFILGCWARAGVVERVPMLPAVPASRIAYAAGMTVGGIAWLWRKHTGLGWCQPH